MKYKLSSKTNYSITDCLLETRYCFYNKPVLKIKIRVNHVPIFDEETGEIIINKKNEERSLRRARMNVVDIAMLNEFEYFGTITISDEKHGKDIENPYLMEKKLCNLFDNYKQRVAPKFEYILVAEFGAKNHRLHFHFLAKGIPKEDLFKNEYHKLDWKLTREKFGHTQIKHICDTRQDRVHVAKYCSKYITKDNIKIGKHRYYCSNGLKRPIKTICESANEALFIEEWLQDNMIAPYVDMEYNKSYALPYIIAKDLKKALEVYREEIWLRRRGLTILPDDIPCPFD